jgi:hypothetical protein
MENHLSVRQRGFMHVPRTAGGSIVNELMKTDWIILGHDVTSPHYMHLSDFRKNHPEKNAHFIGTVRNPYDRLVSAYHFLKAGGDNEMDQKDAEKFVNQFSTFEDFVLKQFSWWYRKRTLRQIHFRPQSYWLYRSKQLLVDQLFRFEQLEELFEYIASNSSIEVGMISHVHKSNHDDYKGYYSKRMIALVKDAYAADLNRFNYSF